MCSDLWIRVLKLGQCVESNSCNGKNSLEIMQVEVGQRDRIPSISDIEAGGIEVHH